MRETVEDIVEQGGQWIGFPLSCLKRTTKTFGKTAWRHEWESEKGCFFVISSLIVVIFVVSCFWYHQSKSTWKRRENSVSSFPSLHSIPFRHLNVFLPCESFVSRSVSRMALYNMLCCVTVILIHHGKSIFLDRKGKAVSGGRTVGNGKHNEEDTNATRWLLSNSGGLVVFGRIQLIFCHRSLRTQQCCL